MSMRIKELRQAKGYTLLQIANLLGVSESTVQRYESGAIANLKYDTAVELAALLGVHPAYLLGWIDDPSPNRDAPLDLSEDELILLDLYRSLNSIGRRRAIQELEDFCEIDRYTCAAESNSDAV